MSKFFVYCRKSSEAEDRQVLSIESQTDEMKELSAKLNVQTEVFPEAMSAKEPGRPIFNQMMKRLYRGEAAGIICWKLDRLARNPVDGGSIIWAIKQHGIKVITPAQTYSQGDDNIILMYIEFGMAQKYIDDLSRNVKRGLRTKVNKGWYPGIAPTGYLNNRMKERGEKDLSNDPDRFILVKRMWELMLSGTYTAPKILSLANREWGFRTRQTRKTGGRPLSRNGLYHIFHNPFYYGWFEFPKGSSQWFKGNHEPMVTKAEFEKVQALLGRGGTTRPEGDRVFAFTGLMRCGECESAVTAEEKLQVICDTCRLKFAYRRRDDCPGCKTPIAEMSKPRFLHYTYYHCTRTKKRTCSQKSIKSGELEKQIVTYLNRIQISERFKTWAIKYLHELHRKETASRNDILRSQQQAYRDCVRQLDQLVKLKTSAHNADGSLLSDEEYGHQRLELLNVKSELEESLQDVGHRVEQWLTLSEKTFEFACTARQKFAEGDIPTKKAIIAAIGSNLTLRDKKLRIEAKKPFLILETSLTANEAKGIPIEPRKIKATQGPNKRTTSGRPRRLWVVDDDRTLELKNESIVAEIYRFFQSSKISPGDFFPELAESMTLV
jgi:site-specific DNA recombinase